MLFVKILHISSLAIYAASLVQYWNYFRSKSKSIGRISSSLLLFATLVHTIMLIVYSAKRGVVPLGQFAGAVTSFAWILAVFYLIQENLLREREFGAFITPVIILAQTMSVFFIDYTRPLASVLQNVMFEIHVSAILIGYSSFTLGFIASVMYLLLFKDIQGHRFGLFYSRLPSLEFLDKVNIRSINIGLIFLTTGILLGMFNAGIAWGFIWNWDPKLTVVLINWLIYIYLAISHLVFNWRGQRTAVISIIGFTVVIFSFFIVTNFTSTIHTF